jgi:hypothetical protein
MLRSSMLYPRTERIPFLHKRRIRYVRVRMEGPPTYDRIVRLFDPHRLRWDAAHGGQRQARELCEADRHAPGFRSSLVEPLKSMSASTSSESGNAMRPPGYRR